MTKRDQGIIRWELGDLLTPQGALTRGAPTDSYTLPPAEDVKISNDCLVWTARRPKRVVDGAVMYDATPLETDPKTRARYEKDMLQSFTGLHIAASQEILQFARCWGPLHLCEHNMPHQHDALAGVAKYPLRMPARTASRRP